MTGRETEIKLRLRDAAEGRGLLERSGFRIVKPRVFEADTLFDTEERALKNRGALLRVREAGDRKVLTFKGPAESGKYKSREELELELSEAETFSRILGNLGFKPVFRYEKYRTEYSETGEKGIATLDETPIGDFLELEGEPAWIDRTAARLGFPESAYVTSSYATLYLEYCRERQISPADMIFRVI